MAAYDPNQDYTQCCECFDGQWKPKNPLPGSTPQVVPSPFKIVLNSDTYQLDREVTGKAFVLTSMDISRVSDQNGVSPQ